MTLKCRKMAETFEKVKLIQKELENQLQIAKKGKNEDLILLKEQCDDKDIEISSLNNKYFKLES